MTVEQALTDYINNSKQFEKIEPNDTSWLIDFLKNPGSHLKEFDEQLVKVIQEKEPQLLNNESNILLTMGNSCGYSFQSSQYIYSLGLRASQVGASQTLSELNGWFNREMVDAYSAVVVFGLRIKNTVKVNSEIMLYPANQVPDSNLLKDLFIGSDGLAVFYKDEIPIEVPVIVAFEKIQFPRIYDSREFDLDKLQNSYNSMEDAIRMVSVINSRNYYVHRRTSRLRDYEPFSNIGMSHCGVKSDVFFADIRTQHSLDIQLISNEEKYQEYFDDIWYHWDLNEEKLKSKIRLSIDRWSQSQHRASDEDKAIEMRVALETLLVKSKKEKKLSTIRDRVKHIFPNDKKICKIAYDIYDAGSYIMHEGTISNKFKKKNRSKKELSELLKIIYIKFPQLVRFVIENGIPDLSENIFRKILLKIKCQLKLDKRHR